MALHPDQLVLDLLAIADDEPLADQLVDRRKRPRAGAARLLVALVRQGLDEKALRPAAALSVVLDDQARRDPANGTDSRRP
jgi:hypothetical protein